MEKVILVTAPYTGTHFSAWLLHLMGADFIYCHAFRPYLLPPNVPAAIEQHGYKLIVPHRNPWDSMHTAFARDFTDFNRHMDRLERIRDLQATYPHFVIPVDEPPVDRAGWARQLADYCGITAIPAEAQAYIDLWPIAGSVKYDLPMQRPATLPDETRIEALAANWGYDRTPTWDKFRSVPRTNGTLLTRDDMREVLQQYRFKMQMGLVL